MRIDIDDVRELINQRLQFATEDYEDDRKRNRNGMKCFHQGAGGRVPGSAGNAGRV